MGFGRRMQGIASGMGAKLFSAQVNRRSKVKLGHALASPKKVSPQKKPTTTAKEVDEEGDWITEGTYVPFTFESTTKSSKVANSQDYMLEWLGKRDDYLNRLLAMEASSSGMKCSICSETTIDKLWRCKDCLGHAPVCTVCCRAQHSSSPLHRVEVWSKNHFAPSWLWKVGISVNLCPTSRCTIRAHTSGETPPLAGDDQESESKDWTNNDDFTYGAKPPGRSFEGGRVVTVVHTNGVHYLPFHFCTCDDRESEDLQLLRFGFYPSTFKHPRTVFTFGLLDDYSMEILECFTSTYHYYAKLRRITNHSFPRVVPDRTRELRRAGRQWRNLKEQKRFGCAHTGKAPQKAQMALFCAACPQPGINLPDDWEEDSEDWKYTRSLVGDGNFTCIHRSQPAQSDVALKSGESFVVAPERYKKHVATAVDEREMPTCHEHRAIADRSKVHKGCDVTGIGAWACMRHGCFCPGSIVDFQKGESDGVRRVILAYDINCQYSVKLHKRMKEGKYLALNEDLIFVYGIGLFHVHGHQDSCYARYALTYIKGAGMASGEILESLWSTLNEAARTTSTMTLAHRAEVLDALLSDSNWKKMLNLVPTLRKNLETAVRESSRADEDFELLNETASVDQRTLWQWQLDKAHAQRSDDVKAMDVTAQVASP
ncbi:hypothetical protein BKA70DRAFT_1237495 [Coprinopsis sp. MPI-PUGE-AT-0042]|nr:hypothetical protein BKA70DRAFT_1237495 [Coprinopsis sp. MPI-PUGE-AT-0042]